MQCSGCALGMVESRLQVDSRLGSAVVALYAVLVDEGSDLFLEDLAGIGSEGLLVHVVVVLSPKG